jgi:pyrroline-5-carboxylate reductase
MSVIEDKKIGFLGAGNMAEALIGGLVKSYLVQPESIIAGDPDPERRERIKRMFAVRVTADNSQVVRFADVIVLAVKPNVVARALDEAGPSVRADQIVISICAGVSLAFLESRLPANPPVVRVMPNIAVKVGAGMSAVSRGSHADEEHLAVAKAILAAAGEVLEIEEKHMDAVTAVAGSGPAYFFYLMEAMEAAALAEGLPSDLALKLVKQTALGAAKLCAESDDTPGELRRQVTSPAGTTEAAIRFLETNNVGLRLVQAVREAAKRARTLGGRT